MEMNDYSKEDIIQALIHVGITENDSIFIHSNIGFFGRLKDGTDKNSFYQIFKEAIFNVIGEGGTLVVPVFTYSYCWNKIFNKEETPGICGIFSEMIRLDSESLRSDDANFSIATIGKHAKYFTQNSPENSFATDSFWGRFLKCDGKFCNFNFDSGSTFIHYVERLLHVPYRYDKKFTGRSVCDEKETEGAFYHFVYDLEKPENSPYFEQFDRWVKEMGIARTADMGKGQIVAISARDTLEVIKQEIQKDPAFLIMGSRIDQ